jgi:2-C-methyl-D-erythritol 4-phosphate cytidylyltransferase
MGFDKVMAPLLGVPLVRWAVGVFAGCDEIGEVVVVVGAGREAEVRAVLSGLDVAGYVEGGATRQESVARGVAAVSGELVAVHDAARPLVTKVLIERCLAEARRSGAATAAERVTDTLERERDGRGIEVVDREGLWRIQTPQVFETKLLRRALRAAAEEGRLVTDETSAVLGVGVSAGLVENPDWNFKVTIPRDVALAEAVLRSRTPLRAD